MSRFCDCFVFSTGKKFRAADKLIFQSDLWILQLTYITHKRICFQWTDYQAVVLIHLLVCISIRWGRLLLMWLLDTNEEINMQIFRLLLAVESLCFVSHGIVLTVSHAIETLVGCSHKQILWLLVFRRRVRTGRSTLLICFGFALRWRFREKNIQNNRKWRKYKRFSQLFIWIFQASFKL